MKARSAVISVLLGSAIMALSSDVHASTVRSREACGIIQTVDATNGLLTVKSDKRKEVLVVKWTRQTQFVRDWKFYHVEKLTSGTRACVYYRTPLFGKPFATKVVLLNGN